jgi:outer membrane protein TolC
MKLKQISETIDSLKTNKEIADRTYNITNDLYTAGNKDLLDLQDADNNLIDANIKILNAENDFLSNYFDLEILLNTNDKNK